MKQLSIILFIATLFACNPYRQISGDVNRKPFERAILLSESAREAPVKQPVYKPGDTVTESRANKEYIEALEDGVKKAYADFESITKLADSLYGGNIQLAEMADRLTRQVDSLMNAARKTPPVVRTIRDTLEVPSREQAAQIQLMQDDANRFRIDINERDIKVNNAKAAEELAEQRLKEAQAARWRLFWIGLATGAGVMAAAGFVLKLKSII